MSVAVTDDLISTTAATTLDKINSASKSFGNKLLDFSRKMKISSNNSHLESELQENERTNYKNNSLILDTSIKEKNKLKNKTTTSIEQETLESNRQKSKINITDNLIDFETSLGTNSTLLQENYNEAFLPCQDDSLKIAIDDTDTKYFPILSRKQFLSRHVKFNYLLDYTKNSKTEFLFI